MNSHISFKKHPNMTIRCFSYMASALITPVAPKSFDATHVALSFNKSRSNVYSNSLYSLKAEYLCYPACRTLVSRCFWKRTDLTVFLQMYSGIKHKTADIVVICWAAWRIFPDNTAIWNHHSRLFLSSSYHQNVSSLPPPSALVYPMSPEWWLSSH